VGGAPRIEQLLFRDGELDAHGTITAEDAGLVDAAGYDYRLKPDSPAIGAGIDPGSAGGVGLTPALEYVHPSGTRPVKIQGAIDIGAYQHGPPP